MYDEFDNMENESYKAAPEPVNEEPEIEKPEIYHYSYDQPHSYREPSPAEPEKSGRLWKKFVLCISLALVFGVVAGAAFQVTGHLGAKAFPKETEAQPEPIAEIPTVNEEVVKQEHTTVPVSAGVDISMVAENAMPSIVAITNKGVQEVRNMFYKGSYPTESAGSGVIIAQKDDELLIATNNHVVKDAKELSVCFSVEVKDAKASPDTEDAENAEDLEDAEESVVQAQIKGTNPAQDLAVVAVKLADIPADIRSQIKVAEIGSGNSLKVGQQVVAIGNALGYGQSVTVGYISALDREVTVDDVTNRLIQTDAAINFGNSGGALLNTSGQLIGINSVKAAATGVEGMGYAIPMETAEPILNDLMDRTTRERVEDTEKGYMGIVPEDVSEEARRVYNMPAGAFVYQVVEGSAAEEAGIEKGNIITEVEGITISSRSELLEQMSYYKAGETIEVVVQVAEGSSYKEKTVLVTLGEKPVDDEESMAETSETWPPQFMPFDDEEEYFQFEP